MCGTFNVIAFSIYRHFIKNKHTIFFSFTSTMINAVDNEVNVEIFFFVFFPFIQFYCVSFQVMFEYIYTKLVQKKKNPSFSQLLEVFVQFSATKPSVQKKKKKKAVFAPYILFTRLTDVRNS